MITIDEFIEIIDQLETSIGRMPTFDEFLEVLYTASVSEEELPTLKFSFEDYSKVYVEIKLFDTELNKEVYIFTLTNPLIFGAALTSSDEFEDHHINFQDVIEKYDYLRLESKYGKIYLMLCYESASFLHTKLKHEAIRVLPDKRGDVAYKIVDSRFEVLNGCNNTPIDALEIKVLFYDQMKYLYFYHSNYNDGEYMCASKSIMDYLSGVTDTPVKLKESFNNIDECDQSDYYDIYYDLYYMYKKRGSNVL